MSQVSLQGVIKNFGVVTVFSALDLKIDDGEFVVLVGPSGCGKTTLLRMIAGLETVDFGSIRIGNRDVTSLAPKDRGISMVFQSYALYPHMDVSRNMGFSLKLRGEPADAIARKVRAAAEVLKIEHLLKRKPRELSGGQRQRVAMGRAMVRDPAIYLFDEPLSNLDAQLRTRMRTEIKRMHLRDRKTVIYVTHDQVEAMTLADRIVVMNKCEIVQIGSPDDLYNRPATIFVASFIGSPAMNFLNGKVIKTAQKTCVEIDGTIIPISPHIYPHLHTQVGETVTVGIRPESLAYSTESGPASIALPIAVIEPCGSEVYVIGDFAGVDVTARCVPRKVPKLREVAHFAIETDAIHLFDPVDGKTLRR